MYVRIQFFARQTESAVFSLSFVEKTYNPLLRIFSNRSWPARFLPLLRLFDCLRFLSRPTRIDSAMLTIYDPGSQGPILVLGVLCRGRLSESKSPFLLKHGRAVKPVVVDNPVGRELEFGMDQAKPN